MYIDLISISILPLASSLKRRVETPKFKVSSANWRLAGHGWLVAATTDRIQQILRISGGFLLKPHSAQLILAQDGEGVFLVILCKFQGCVKTEGCLGGKEV